MTVGLTSDPAPPRRARFIFRSRTRPRPTVEGQESTALGTADVKQLKVELDFNATGAVYTVAGIAQARIGAKSVRFFETWQIEQLALQNGIANFNALSTQDDYLGMIIGSGTASASGVLVDQWWSPYDQFKLDAMTQLRSQNRGGSASCIARPERLPRRLRRFE